MSFSHQDFKLFSQLSTHFGQWLAGSEPFLIIQNQTSKNFQFNITTTRENISHNIDKKMLNNFNQSHSFQ